MTTFFAPGGLYPSKVSGPSSSARSEYSRRYDYSGLAEHIKRQDAVSTAREQKRKALSAGDYDAAIEAGGRVRDLVSSLRLNDPYADERTPISVANPFVKLESESGGSSSSTDSGGYELAQARQPAAGAAAQIPPEDEEEKDEVAAVRRRVAPDGDPRRFAGMA